MAYETELANIVHQTDIVSALASKAFVQQDTVFPLIATQSFPDNTNVIKFPKMGSLTAGTQAESAAYTYAAGDEITDSAVTITGTKKSQAVKITLENRRFGGPMAAVERYVGECVRAINRLAASELKTLIATATNSVTATDVLTKDDILDARYNVASSVMSATEGGKYVGYFDYKGVNELSKELTSTTASAFSGQVDLGILGNASAGTPKGELFDVVFFETSGLATSGGDDVAAIWDPAAAICCGVDGINGFQMRLKEPEAAEPWNELFMWTFWHMALWNDTAVCKVLSDT